MSEATKTEAKKTAAPKTEAKKTEEVIDIKSMNIFQRVAAITAELGTVAKNMSVKAGSESYKAVSERDIIDAVKPLEEKYRVYSYPSAREILESETLENERVYNGNVKKTTSFFTRVQTEYTFLNIDKPEERFTTIVFSEGIDTGDKGSGKAMTYADKYALMKAYKISTGDDPDQNASEENSYTRSGNSNRWNQGGYGGNQGGYGGGYQNQYQGGGQNQGQYQGGNQPIYGNGNRGYQPPAPPAPPAPPVPPQPKQEAPGIKIQCKNCGGIITDAHRPDGSLMTASEVAHYSIQQYGLAYCVTCQNQLRGMRSGQAKGQK